MRGIQKTLSIIYNKKIHIQNIVHWIKNADKILKEEIEERQKEVKSKEIKILEMDETRNQTMMCLHNHCSLSFGKVSTEFTK